MSEEAEKNNGNRLEAFEKWRERLTNVKTYTPHEERKELFKQVALITITNPSYPLILQSEGVQELWLSDTAELTEKLLQACEGFARGLSETDK